MAVAHGCDGRRGGEHGSNVRRGQKVRPPPTHFFFVLSTPGLLFPGAFLSCPRSSAQRYDAWLKSLKKGASFYKGSLAAAPGAAPGAQPNPSCKFAPLFFDESHRSADRGVLAFCQQPEKVRQLGTHAHTRSWKRCGSLGHHAHTRSRKRCGSLEHTPTPAAKRGAAAWATRPYHAEVCPKLNPDPISNLCHC